MKQIKLYNVIFPLWLILFFPPVILVTLAGNYIIDSVVVISCFYVYKLSTMQINLKMFYKKTILKVWLYGFLADIFGALILFFIGILGDSFGIPYDLISAVNYDPFRHPVAIIIIVFAMLISGLFIFLFNYNNLRHQIEDKHLRLRIALTIAIVTIPWTFLLPTKWFYRGI